MLVGSTEEQGQLGQAAGAMLEQVSSEREVRRLMATPNGFEAQTWSALVDLGVVGLLIPESLGGAGGSLPDVGVVLERMGRRLTPGPYLSTAVLAVTTLLAVRPGPAEALLMQIADGSCVATLAVTEQSGRWREEDIATRAVERDGEWRISGTKCYVPDGAAADLVLVVAGTDAGPALFAVRGDADSLSRIAQPTMDQTRKQATLEFADVLAQQLPTTKLVWDVVDDVCRIGMVAVSAEQVGGALEVLDLVLAHANSRTQFGKPIGSFQAIQHKCADMVLEIEAARSATYYAQLALAMDAPDAATAAEVAKSFCSDTYRRVADSAVQIFGGMGMTWEHPIHLYMKRARSSEVLFGTPSQRREQLATLIGL
jgi:alkylation response protein AidB-like acyl-CoA dehydrogenase